MKKMKTLLLFFAVAMFIVSCSKDSNEPPALGDHTEEIPGGNTNEESNTNTGSENNESGEGSENEGTDEFEQGMKVLSLGENWGSFITNGPKRILYVHNAEKYFEIYSPDEEGIYDGGTQFEDENAWEATAGLIYIPNAIKGATDADPDGSGKVDAVYAWNTPPAGLFRFDPKSSGDLTGQIHPTTNPEDPFPDNFGFFHGDGWDQYTVVALDEQVLIIDDSDNGEVMSVDKGIFTSDWSTWNVMGNRGPDEPNAYARPHLDLGMSITEYAGAIGLENHLLIIQNDGSLMSYAIDGDGELDAAVKIGEGWDTFSHFVSDGKTMLVVDAGGDVYRYHIDFDTTDNNPVN